MSCTEIATNGTCPCMSYFAVVRVLCCGVFFLVIYCWFILVWFWSIYSRSFSQATTGIRNRILSWYMQELCFNLDWNAYLWCHLSQLCWFLEPDTSQYQILMKNNLCHVLSLQSMLVNTNKIHREFFPSLALVFIMPLLQLNYGC